MKKNKIMFGLATSVALSSAIGAVDVVDDIVTTLDNNNDTNIEMNDLKVNAKTSNIQYKATTNVNIRSGRGTNYSKLGLLKKGETITVESINNGWAKFTYKSKTAYVSANYLAKVSAVSSNTTSNVQTSIYKVTANSLNVRKGAGTSYAMLGSLKKGETIAVISINNGWAKFTYKNKDAYVSSSYIQKVSSSNNGGSTGDTVVNTPSTENAVKYKVTATSLNIRKGAGTNFAILGKVKRDDIVDVVSISGGWAKVKYNNTYGYVNTSYIVKNESSPSTEDKNPDSNNSDKIESGNAGSSNNNSNTSGSGTVDSMQAFKNEVLRLVNIERAKEGIGQLSMDSKLSSVAQIKSQEMVDYNYFDHNSPVSGTPFELMKSNGITYRVAGENIAKAYTSPEAVVSAWMNSAGHRKNIMNSRFTHLGVGIAKKENGTLYWTQMFTGQN